MKNVFFTGMCLCFLSGCAAGYRLPPEVTAAAVGDRAQVVYSPAAGVWSEGGRPYGVYQVRFAGYGQLFATYGKESRLFARFDL